MASASESDEKRRKLVQDALKQWRATRSLIDPALLDRARDVIAGKSGQRKNDQAGAVIPIDRTQNLRAVMKFLELKAHDKDMQKQIADILPKA